jgi:hypothetical protein
MALEVLLDQPSIVFVGSFNPAIFHPRWLIDNGLVPSYQYELLNGEQLVLTGDHLYLELPNEIKMQVQRNRMALTTENPASFITLLDLAKGILVKLPEMPIKQMGLNVLSDVDGFDVDEWIALGDKMSPHDFWKKIFGAKWEENDAYGIQAVRIRAPWVESEIGHTNFKVGISPRHKHPARVIEIEANNHCELNGAAQALDHLEKNPDFYKHSKEVFNKFFSQAIGKTI